MRWLIATFLLSATVSAQSQSQSPIIPHPQVAPSNYQQIRTNDALETIASQLSAIREQTASIEKARIDREGNPFWPPIWSNWFLILLTGGTVVAAVITLGKLERQTKASEAAAAAAQASADAAATSANASVSQLERMDRPWVKVRLELAGPLEVSEQGDTSIRVKVRVTNVGRSIAQHVDVKLFATPSWFTDSEPHAIRSEVWQRFNEWRATELPELGTTVFPSSEPTISTVALVKVAAEDWARMWAQHLPHLTLKPRAERPIRLLIYGIVTYSQDGVAKHRHTQFGQELRQINESRFPPDVAPMAVNTAMEKLRLVYSPIGLNHAD